MFSPSWIFLLDNDPKRNDWKLRFRVRCSEWIFALGVGFRVESDKWNRETQRCKNGTSHGSKKISASVINREISRYEFAVTDLAAEYQQKKIYPSKVEFRDRLLSMIGREPKKEDVASSSLFSRFDEFVESEGYLHSWGESLLKKFGTFRNHLFTFNPELSYEDLTDSVLTDFVNYLHRAGLRNVSVDKLIRYFRWFLRWSSEKGYYKGLLHQTFRPRLKGADGSSKVVIYLTWEELLHFHDFDFSSCGLPVEQSQALERVRDVFCFLCFTGLRYSDVAKLSKSDIRDGVINVVTQKTTDSLRIELNEFSRGILEKYKDVTFQNGLALPVISNQKMNDQLKIAARLAELNSEQRIVYFVRSERFEVVSPLHSVISTHCGRRTFVVNAFYLGVPSEVIMSWTGHKNFASMKPYLKIVDNLKAREMDKFKRPESPGTDLGD